MRTQLYIKSVGSAYALIAVNIAYSLAVIPLALHYVGKQEFGLWALTLQIGIVLRLADGGLSAALTRILIEYKDDKNQPAYRQTLYSVWLALVCVAILIVLAMSLLAEPLSSVFGIPDEYLAFYPKFIFVYILVFFLGFALKPITLVIVAHQRQYLFSISSIVGLFVAFPVLWIALANGLGLWSLIISLAFSISISQTINYTQARKLGYLPRFGLTDCLQYERLKEVASFGFQRIVAAFGNTILLTAPTFLITRFIGLDATAIWAIGTRTMQLSHTVTSKLADVAQPILTEMYVRGEDVKLRKRFGDVILVTLGVAGSFAGLIAASNSDFISLWTSGKIAWDPYVDKYMAVYFIISILKRLFWMPVLISKNLGFSRYMAFIEASVFLLFILCWPRETLSLKTIILGLVLASICTSLPVYVLRSAKLLNQRVSQTLKHLSKAMLSLVIPLICLGVMLAYFLPTSTWLLLIAKSTVIGIASIVLLLSISIIRRPALGMASRIFKYH